MKILTLLFSISFFFYSTHTFAQGCSDAGVCTMGNPHVYTDDTLNASDEKPSVLNYKISQSVGLGEQNTIHYLSVAELNWAISPAFYLQVKVPYLINTGNLGSTRGIGDISLSATVIKKIKSHSSFNTIFGFKIPVNNSNLKEDSKPYPMPYQTSLGTFDAILGFVYQYKQWSFSTAYQKVLSSINENDFSELEWGRESVATEYFYSYKYSRSDDAILKAERNIHINKKWIFSPSVLAISRVRYDGIVDIQTNDPGELRGSSGLTLNVIGNSSHLFKNKSAIDFTVAFPLIVRVVRADGLTRSFIAGVSYRF